MAERRPNRGILAKLAQRGFSVSVSSAANVAFFFVRNVMLARMLGPENFGVAVAILTISAAVDVVSDLGWDKFLIQWDQNGHSRAEAQGVVHFLRFSLAVAMALLIVLLSIPLANALDVPQAAAAIATLAIPILLRGAIHIDYKHRQRDLQFGGEAIVETSRSMVDLIVAAIAGLLLHDYWAMTLAITGGSVASFLASHVIARGHAWPRWIPGLGYSILGFGTPLVLNNVLVYIAGQGDRLLVGMKYGVHQLASYGAALTLVAGPQAVLSRGLMMVALPVLSRARHNMQAFEATFAQVGAIAVAACCVASTPIILFGPELVHVVFGHGFAPPQLLTMLLAIAQSLNILRTWAISGLVSHAHTRTVPLANIARLIGFAAAVVTAVVHGPLEAVAGCLAVGESFGVAAALAWHSRLIRRPPLAVLALLAVLAAGWAVTGAVQLACDSWPLKMAALASVLTVNVGLCLAVAQRERSKARKLATSSVTLDQSGIVQ